MNYITGSKHKQIPKDEIDFGNRNRIEYGEIDDLLEDIENHGLLQPIGVVDKKFINPDSDLKEMMADDTKEYLLLWGGRRLTAILKSEKIVKISCIVIQKDIDILTAKTIELHENLKRKNLTWVEESIMVRDIHAAYVKVYGEASRGANNSGHTLGDTADLMQKSIPSIARLIKIANAVEDNPELKDKFSNQSELLKHLENEKIKLAEAELAKRQYKRYLQQSKDKKLQFYDSFVIDDCREGMKKLESSSYSLVEIDPPYGIDLITNKRGNQLNKDEYVEVDIAEWKSLMQDVLRESKRIIKDDGWIIAWFAMSNFGILKDICSELDLNYSDAPGIWIKKNGQNNAVNYQLTRSYENFIYIRKSASARICRKGRSNVFAAANVKKDAKYHITQRPIVLMEDIISTFVNRGKVCVPFAGSGATLKSCANLKLEVIGFDLSESHKNGFINSISKQIHGEYSDEKNTEQESLSDTEESK